jgi:hypothetical protein
MTTKAFGVPNPGVADAGNRASENREIMNQELNSRAIYANDLLRLGAS